MKIKYIFTALIACLGLAVACDDDDKSVLEELQVSKSYVAIPMTGGTDAITVKSSAAWAFDESTIPNWLTVSALSGNSGETQVTFTAPETKVGRNCELKINVGNTAQHINVIQGIKSAENSTCAQVIAGEDGKLYRVTATVTSITSTSWGNMWLNDGTGEVYVYGTLDKDGKEQNFSSLGIEVGDVVTVEGPKKTYNSTVELEKVTVIKIVKSLLKIEPAVVTAPKEDTTFTVKAAVKSGATFDWKLDPDNEWLHIISTKTVDDTVFVNCHAAANPTVVPRTAMITFSATNGSQTTTQTLTVKQSANAPELMSIADGLKTTYAHVKGTVTAVTKQGYVLTDDSGSALVFYGSSYNKDYVVGDQVELIGTPGAYNFGPQFTTPIDLDEKKGTTTYAYPTPTLVDEAFVNSTISQIKDKDKNTQVITVQYVQVYGTVVKSGNYTNVNVDGVSSSVAQVSPYQMPSSFTLNADDKVKINGYLVSVSGSSKRYLNIAITSVEPWSGGDVVTPKTLYENTFETDPTKEWTIENKKLATGLTLVWSYNSSKYMKASAYYNKKNLEAESWLISPEIDATSEKNVYLSFQHVQKYFVNSSNEFTLWAQKDGGAWTQVTIPNYSTGKDWTLVDSGTIDLSAFAGGKIRFAFKYVSSSEAAGTWEIKNVKVTNTK